MVSLMVKVNEMVEKLPVSRELVCEYVWARYIDNKKPKRDVDEEQALKLFEDYYGKHPLNTDDECFYYGILLYERAFSDELNRARYLVKAKEVFETYRNVSGETEWDVIEDRFADVCEIIEREGLAEKVLAVKTDLPAIEGMVIVPGGPFPFGPEGKQVVLEAFYMDKYPVTNAEYRKFIEETKYRTPELWNRSPELAQDDLPVTGVSWMDALQYCKWAKKALPTAEQWEKAARGPKGNTYPWGEDPPSAEKGNFLLEGADPRLLSPKRYERAGASPFGCCAMSGTVWEWTNTSYPDEEGAQILKGGSYVDPGLPEYLAGWATNWANKKEKNDVIGFRCTRTVDAR